MLVNINQAKTRLSALLRLVLAGEQVVIARAGQPVALLIPIRAAAGPRVGVRLGGLKAASLKLAPDFQARPRRMTICFVEKCPTYLPM